MSSTKSPGFGFVGFESMIAVTKLYESQELPRVIKSTTGAGSSGASG